MRIAIYALVVVTVCIFIPTMWANNVWMLRGGSIDQGAMQDLHSFDDFKPMDNDGNDQERVGDSSSWLSWLLNRSSASFRFAFVNTISFTLWVCLRPPTNTPTRCQRECKALNTVLYMILAFPLLMTGFWLVSFVSPHYTLNVAITFVLVGLAAFAYATEPPNSQRRLYGYVY